MMGTSSDFGVFCEINRKINNTDKLICSKLMPECLPKNAVLIHSTGVEIFHRAR